MLALLLLSFAALGSTLDEEPPALPPGTHTTLQLTVADGPLPLRLDCSEDVTFVAQCSGLELEARFFRPDGTFAGSVTDAGSLDQVTVHLPGGGIASLQLVGSGAASGVVDVSVMAGFTQLPEGLELHALRAERTLARAESRRGDPGLGRIHDLLNGAWSCLRLKRINRADEASQELWEELAERSGAADPANLDADLRQLVYLTLEVRARVAEERLDFAQAERLVEQLAGGREDPLIDALWLLRKAAHAWNLGRPYESEAFDRELLAMGASPDTAIIEPLAWEELTLIVSSRLAQLQRDVGNVEQAAAFWQAAVERALTHGVAEAFVALHEERAVGRTSRLALATLREQAAGAGPVSTDTLHRLAMAEVRRGHVGEAEELLLRAERLAAERGHLSEQVRMLDFLATLGESRGDLIAARGWHERSLELAPDLDLRTSQGLTRMFLEASLAVDASPDLRRAQLDAMLTEVESLGNVDALLELLEHFVALSLDEGRSEAALAYAEQHAELAPRGWRAVRVPLSHANLAEARIAVGQALAADESARQAVASLREDTRWSVRVGVWHAAALSALAVDEPRRAEQALLRGLEVLAEVPSDPDPMRHALSRSQGLVSNWLPLNVDVTVACARAAADDGLARDAVSDGYERHGRLKARVLLEGLLADTPRLVGARPSDIAVRLGPDEVFVEYLAGRQSLHALVIQAGQVARFLDLGERGRIESLVEAYVDGLATDDPLMAWPDVAALGGDLGQRLLAPALERCAGTPRRLVVAPSGWLSTLPFEALVLDAADDVGGSDDVTFAADALLITTAPSGSVFVALEAARSVSDRRLLAVADPVYEASARSAAMGASRATPLARLVSSREEVLGIADLLAADDAGTTSPRAGLGRHGRVNQPSLEVLLGENATRAALLDGLAAASLVHVAAHGLVDAADPRHTGLVLSGGELLTVPDILDLDLDADLAVLSACSTARGAVFAGEGVQSLAQAFLRAGARTVVASLWQVDDASTAALMQAFYARLFAGDPVPVAFSAARQRLRGRPVAANGLRRGDVLPGVAEHLERERLVVADHPHRWAPFVVVGR